RWAGPTGCRRSSPAPSSWSRQPSTASATTERPSSANLPGRLAYQVGGSVGSDRPGKEDPARLGASTLQTLQDVARRRKTSHRKRRPMTRFAAAALMSGAVTLGSCSAEHLGAGRDGSADTSTRLDTLGVDRCTGSLSDLGARCATSFDGTAADLP